jgi:hypothetical protein
MIALFAQIGPPVGSPENRESVRLIDATKTYRPEWAACR